MTRNTFDSVDELKYPALILHVSYNFFEHELEKERHGD